MLRIYEQCLQLVRHVKPLVDKVAQHNRTLANQTWDSCMSVPQNVAEASGNRRGNRRSRHETALGSAEETRSSLQIAEAAGYITVEWRVYDNLDHIIATLSKLV